MRLTSWYSGDQKPIRIGYYERQVYGIKFTVLSWWNGSMWLAYDQHRPWRGLVEGSKP